MEQNTSLELWASTISRFHIYTLTAHTHTLTLTLIAHTHSSPTHTHLCPCTGQWLHECSAAHSGPYFSTQRLFPERGQLLTHHPTTWRPILYSRYCMCVQPLSLFISSLYIMIVSRLGELFRKLWNPHHFKAHVSPHEMLQAVASTSQKKFKITEQGKYMYCWVGPNYMHVLCFRRPYWVPVVVIEYTA